MKEKSIGRWFKDGEVICRQGEIGDSMYLVQNGRVELIHRDGSHEFCVGVLEAGQFWGEDALLERDYVRNATARALGEACLLSIERRMFLHRVHEDPSFVLKVMQQMSRRAHGLQAALIRSANTAAVMEAITERPGKPAETS